MSAEHSLLHPHFTHDINLGHLVQAIVVIATVGGGVLGGYLSLRSDLDLQRAEFRVALGGHEARLSAPFWTGAQYGPAGAHQYDRLTGALALDQTAALEAASWGLFQILGANFAICGFAAVEDYVAAMCRSEADQLQAFGEFCRHNGLDRALQAQDCTRFALGYNGPAEADNDYDTKLDAAYQARLRAVPPPPPPDPGDAEADALNRNELS